MEISPFTNPLNTVLQKDNNRSTTQRPDVAFGIGQKKEVALSPQGQILQKIEQQQATRQAELTNQSNTAPSTPAQPSDYVRVSSSIGNAAQKNNLTAEQATEVYRSIEKLLG